MAFWRSGKDSEKVNDDEVRSILETCCRGQQPAKILLDGGLAEARFESLAEEMVQFRLTEPAEITFMPLSLCFVTFHLAHRTYAFVGKVHDYGYPKLLLQVPTQIAVAEGRSAYRVPVTEQSGLSVRVTTKDNALWDAKAIDISFAGVLIACDSKKSPALDIGSHVALELGLGDHVVQVAGIIRRQEGLNRYGLFFPDSVVKGEICPAEGLRQLVVELERTWLQTRPR